MPVPSGNSKAAVQDGMLCVPSCRLWCSLRDKQHDLLATTALRPHSTFVHVMPSPQKYVRVATGAKHVAHNSQ